MSPPRMIAVLAIGSIVATLAGAEAALLVPLAWFVAFVAALAIGGLVVFPVYTNFDSDADAAAEGGGVGYCAGLLPLAGVVRNAFTDEPVGELCYSAGCDD
jgi:hypothetical protein